MKGSRVLNTQAWKEYSRVTSRVLNTQTWTDRVLEGHESCAQHSSLDRQSTRGSRVVCSTFKPGQTEYSRVTNRVLNIQTWTDRVLEGHDSAQSSHSQSVQAMDGQRGCHLWLIAIDRQH